MKLDTNIAGVMHRMGRRRRDLQVALDRTLAPAAWEESLRRTAKVTIWALAQQSEWGFVEAFLATVLVFASPLKDGFFARMNNPLPPALTVEDFMMARGLQTRALAEGSGATLFSDFLNQFDELMTEWVATEKRKDRRDWSKSDEEIGRWIGYLMLTPDSQLSDRPAGEGRCERAGGEAAVAAAHRGVYCAASGRAAAGQ